MSTECHDLAHSLTIKTEKNEVLMHGGLGAVAHNVAIV